jgi:hypothetical protein
MAALKIFEAAEANLVKIERLWQEMVSRIRTGVAFGDDPDYEDRCRSMTAVLAALPKIDGWKPDISPPDLNEISQNRFDAMEIDELEARISVESWIAEPGRGIREYRFRFNQKRRELIRETLVELLVLPARASLRRPEMRAKRGRRCEMKGLDGSNPPPVTRSGRLAIIRTDSNQTAAFS